MTDGTRYYCVQSLFPARHPEYPLILPKTDFTTEGIADDDSQLGGIIQNQVDNNPTT